jgi:sodium pump decarboxylase gamma subunit
MSQEAYMYTVMTAVVGISIVFVFLTFLSILMSGIKSLFGEKPVRESEGKAAMAEAETVDTAAAAREETIARSKGSGADWVQAAAVVFLMEEAMEARRSAAAWKPSPEEKSDPWVTMPRMYT